MAEAGVLNLTNMIGSLPPSWVSLIKSGLVLLGLVSFFFLIYLVYMVISIVLSIKRAKRLKEIEEKLDKIYKKVVEKK